jgi:hypothetical protein
MDRERIVNQYEEGQRDYDPIQPRSGFRELLRKIWAPILALLGLLAKLGSLAKFGAVFVAFGGYALIWGWKFALGVIVLIFLHEMGHFIEAWRERLNPSWPVFIPFLGAYVRYTGGNAWTLTGLTTSRGARVLRLLPEPAQPASDRDPRRRRDLACDAVPLDRARPRAGDRLGHSLRGHGAFPRDRRVRGVSAAATPLMQDAR